MHSGSVPFPAARGRAIPALLLTLCLLWLVPVFALAQPARGAPVQSSPDRSAAAAPAPRIGIMVMQPGEIFWERFGHDSIVVVDPLTGAATSYNFGFFDPTEPDFVARFVRGDMRYRLAAVPYEQDLVLYREEGRGVAIHWLDLDDAQAHAIAEALSWNALPENAYYRYDYFKDNCSTRVRDAVDRALAGGLHRHAEGRSQGLSWRDEAVRLASPAPWMWLGFDIGLGPASDEPMSLWQQAFVPRHLADMLGEARNSRGRPLIGETQQILPHLIAPEPPAQERRWWRWGLPGVVIGAALACLARRKPRLFGAIVIPFWLLAGVVGALLLFLWFGTEHRMAWGNHNLLLLNPLAWFAMPGAWALLRGRVPGRWFRFVLLSMCAWALAAVFLHWVPVQPQRNAHWIALLLPVHAGIAWAFARRSGAAK